MRILIVEDDVFFQKFYSTKLKENKFDVDVALDGQDGLAKIAQSKPDVILLDLIMPKMDGFEFLEKLSKTPAYKKIPILVFSTLGAQQDIERAKKLGALDYANKSFFDFDVLLAKIMSVLKNKTV